MRHNTAYGGKNTPTAPASVVPSNTPTPSSYGPCSIAPLNLLTGCGFGSLNDPVSAFLCVTHVSGSYRVSARSFNYERDALRQTFEYARKALRIILEKPMRSCRHRCG